MISLKAYLDLKSPAPAAEKPDSDDLLSSTVECYRSALSAMGHCCAQACPTVGLELQQSLSTLEPRLTAQLTSSGIKETEHLVEKHLQQWSTNTAEYLKGKANEVKDLLIVLAHTAESLGERDQRYAKQLHEFTDRLQTIADLEDLTEVRASLVESAAEMKTCVDNMAREGIKSVAQLRAQVTSYQSKLEEAEQLAARDTLTGLANRRHVEHRIEERITQIRGFCVVMIDLNGFKQINDAYGHLVGDDLLKQFAGELRSCARITDVVGRWGGDEFIVILDCSLKDAQLQVERIQQWVLGDYTLHRAAQKFKVRVDASIGVASWNPGESMHEVLQRADAAMYQVKSTGRG